HPYLHSFPTRRSSDLFSLLRVIFSFRFIPRTHLKEKIFDLPTGELTKFRSNTDPFLQFLLIRYHHFNLPVAGRVEGLHNRNIDCSDKFKKMDSDVNLCQEVLK